MAEEEGAVLIGLFPIGSWMGEKADAQMRFQQTRNGLRLGGFFRLMGQSVAPSRVLRQDRPRLRGGQNGGVGAKGKGHRKGGRGKDGGKAAPKVAVIPLIPGVAQ